jgi:AcrR family transcriptional regulator
MARSKEFDRDTVLKDAMKVFGDHGYEGTSTEVLMREMGISRQSMYDTFGDKRQLYLEALQNYIADRVAGQIRTLNSTSSPLKGIEAVLDVLALKAPGESGCMGISAICEFGRSDQEIAILLATADRTLAAALEQRVAEAKAAGEVAAEVETRTAAEFLKATIAGIKLAARGGAPVETLRNIGRLAVRSLK